MAFIVHLFNRIKDNKIYCFNTIKSSVSFGLLFTDNENVSQEISFAFSSVILSGVYFLLYIVVSVCKDTKSRAQYKETRFLFFAEAVPACKKKTAANRPVSCCRASPSIC